MKKRVIFTLTMAGMLCASLAGCHKKAAETTVETDYALEDETDVALADEEDEFDSDDAEFDDETDEYDDGFTVETSDDDSYLDDAYDEFSDVAGSAVDAAGNALSSAQQYVQNSLRKNSDGEEPSVDDEGNLHMDGYRLVQMERETIAFNNEEYIDYNTDATTETAAAETAAEEVAPEEAAANTEG